MAAGAGGLLLDRARRHPVEPVGDGRVNLVLGVGAIALARSMGQWPDGGEGGLRKAGRGDASALASSATTAPLRRFALLALTVSLRCSMRLRGPSAGDGGRRLNIRVHAGAACVSAGIGLGSGSWPARRCPARHARDAASLKGSPALARRSSLFFAVLPVRDRGLRARRVRCGTACSCWAWRGRGRADPGDWDGLSFPSWPTSRPGTQPRRRRGTAYAFNTLGSIAGAA